MKQWKIKILMHSFRFYYSQAIWLQVINQSGCLTWCCASHTIKDSPSVAKWINQFYSTFFHSFHISSRVYWFLLSYQIIDQPTINLKNNCFFHTWAQEFVFIYFLGVQLIFWFDLWISYCIVNKNIYCLNRLR